MKYIEYFRELRNRILLCFAFLIVSFFFSFYNVNYISEILTFPLSELLDGSDNKRMIFTGLQEVFVSNLKISLFSAFLISIPFFICQLILFSSPALYKSEKKIFFPLVILIIFFFFMGIFFAYFFLIPLIWSFFISYENFIDVSLLSIELESRYSEYMKLTMFLLLSSGLSFEFPIVIIFMTKIGLFSELFLKKNRKFFLIGILVFSALFSPPDIISQIGIAIPLIIFYELSILFIRFFIKKS